MSTQSPSGAASLNLPAAPDDVKPDIVYGRLLESAHISGYGFERMVDELEWLLEGDRWQSVGPGHTDVNAFLRSVDLSAFNLTDKKSLHKRIKELQPTASTRAIGEATGTPQSTVHLHLREGEQNCSDAAESHVADLDLQENGEQNCSPEPTTHVTLNSGNEEWYTPPIYTDAARLVLGCIDLDPASSDVANTSVRASQFFTESDDGLSQQWKGRVWMNPPYTTGRIDRFVDKLLEHHVAGDVPAAVVLTNNATETRWWQRLAQASSAVCFVAGRIRFLSANGADANSPLQGQTIVYLGPDHELFIENFRQFGMLA